MIWLAMLILAVVQGIGEFLPISSKGHISILASLFEQLGIDLSGGEGGILALEIVLHAGTLATIFVFYWRRIVRLFGEEWRVIWLVVVGTIPAMLVGVLAKKYFTGFLESPLLCGLLLPITGMMLFWSDRHAQGVKLAREMTVWDALVVGFSQALALLPGISRSGWTIAAGLKVGLRRDEAATFSFLLAIPAIGGAAVLHLADLAEHPPSPAELQMLSVAAVVSFLVGLAALYWLVRWLEAGKLHYFAWWVIPVGVVVIVWRLSVFFLGA